MDIYRDMGEFSREHIGLPFEWGKMDCNTLALRWAARVCGNPVGEDIIGAYADRDEAAEFASGYNGDMASVLAGAGFRKFDTQAPREGDIVIVQDETEPFQRCHVAVGSGRFLSARGSRGVFVGPLSLLPDFVVLRYSGE